MLLRGVMGGLGAAESCMGRTQVRVWLHSLAAWRVPHRPTATMN